MMTTTKRKPGRPRKDEVRPVEDGEDEVLFDDELTFGVSDKELVAIVEGLDGFSG